mgnify:CR=1 FL=1
MLQTRRKSYIERRKSYIEEEKVTETFRKTNKYRCLQALKTVLKPT